MPHEVTKIWGREVWIVNTHKYCGKLLYLNKGWQSSYHYHRKKDETFYVLAGRVQLCLNKEIIMLNPGDSIRLAPRDKHSFAGIEDSLIIEFSTHHDDKDSYRLTQSGKIDERQGQ